MDTPRKICTVCSKAVSTEYDKHRCDYLCSIEVGSGFVLCSSTLHLYNSTGKQHSILLHAAVFRLCVCMHARVHVHKTYKIMGTKYIIVQHEEMQCPHPIIIYHIAHTNYVCLLILKCPPF
jgi:hypothetical protein